MTKQTRCKGDDRLGEGVIHECVKMRGGGGKAFSEDG